MTGKLKDLIVQKFKKTKNRHKDRHAES